MILDYAMLKLAKKGLLKGTMLKDYADHSQKQAIENGFGIDLVNNLPANIEIRDAGNQYSEGAYIPYIANKVSYFATSKRENVWLCSGPFSGCKFEIGTTSDGRIYGAHIFMGGKNSRKDAKWDELRDGKIGMNSRHLRRKITLSEADYVQYGGGFIASFVFVVIKKAIEQAEWIKVTAKQEQPPDNTPIWRILKVEKKEGLE
jgi:hypothetical protein